MQDINFVYVRYNSCHSQIQTYLKTTKTTLFNKTKTNNVFGFCLMWYLATINMDEANFECNDRAPHSLLNKGITALKLR